MDAVLPLIARDVSRARILLRSLRLFTTELGTLWVVSPDEQQEEVRSLLIEEGLKINVVGETSIVPELNSFRDIGGWYKQQMIKLAMAQHVTTPFYLTLDADVVVTRSLPLSTLISNQRALVYTISEDLHPTWYKRVEALLASPLPRSGIVHNVTPAVLSQEAVCDMFSSMAQRMTSGKWSQGLRGLRQRYWRWRSPESNQGHLFLLAGLRWTEYALYYSYLELVGKLEHYHYHTPVCIYDIERSVWARPKDGILSWRPNQCFEGEGPPWFVVIQSNTHLPAHDVAKTLRQWLGDIEGVSDL